ncbi:MAG: acyl-CoA dehydrogenase family protein [Gammaproteobacteria bacterium]|nr:acyl-CoA dehydrogenase family protein [Gammaproteobacteria bacterium]
MALVLDEDQALIKDTAREFCSSQAPVAQLRKLRDEADPLGYCQETWKKMAELGWAGIVIPEEYGGTEFGWMALGAVLEEQGRHLTASPLFATVVLGASALLLGGSQSQRESLLPRIAGGDLTLALALEEGPHHAPFGSALSARAEGKGWKLSGQKRFVIDGHSAQQLLVVARSSGKPGDRAGLSLFLVPGDADGLQRTRSSMVDSRNAALIDFADVSVDASALVGELHKAADILEPLLERARICMAAEMMGTMDEAFARTMDYIRERKQFGVVIGSFQGLKHRAADMFTEIELARSTLLDALSALDEAREDVPMLAALAKAKVGEALHRVSLEALQMHGGVGMTDEFDVGLFLKRARVQEQAFGSQAFLRDRYATLAGF